MGQAAYLKQSVSAHVKSECDALHIHIQIYAIPDNNTNLCESFHNTRLQLILLVCKSRRQVPKDQE
jgi:hypothetical protein